jgi:hypothetical protein
VEAAIPPATALAADGFPMVVFADGRDAAVVVLATGAGIFRMEDEPAEASPVGAIEIRLSLTLVIGVEEVDGVIGAVMFEVSAALDAATVDCPGRLVSFRGSERVPGEADVTLPGDPVAGSGRLTSDAWR